MGTSFVILHYLAEDVTCRCLDSLLSLKGGEGVTIVVVDNCSPDGSGERLRKKYAVQDRVHFVTPDSNLGFARGNNAGYRYAVEHFDPDFVVVMNNDVIIDDPDFVTRIESAYKSKPFAVLGPDILSAATGKHQNPYRPVALSLNEARRLRMKMLVKRALLPVFYALGQCGKPCFSDTEWQNAAEGCVLHGACLVFSRDFIGVRRLAFNPGTFLYCEEDILNAECARGGLLMRYSPDLKVRHLEDCSTQAAGRNAYSKARRKYGNLVRSLGVLVGTLDGQLGWFEKNIMYHCPCLLSDKVFLELKWKSKMGTKLNLDNPLTFNEKIQWLKLYDRKPEYRFMTDKSTAKEYAGGIVGKEHIIPTLGIYDSVAEIPWDRLPESFVLKCTHDSGGIAICKDKSTFDRNAAIRTLSKGLRTDFYFFWREWAYKGIKPRIICEKYMVDERQPDGLVDYKFFCFNGKPQLMFIATDRGKEGVETKFDFFDMDFNHLPFTNGHPNAVIPPRRPEKWEEMKEIASRLSRGMRHLRVDLYEIDGKVYFGELTFYHWSGLKPFNPVEWDFRIGKLLRL